MKKESHKSITRKAIDIYCGARHSQLTSVLNNGRFRSAIIKGSVDEDGKTFTRLLNWHFYPSNNKLREQDKIDCYFLDDIVTPTSEKILLKRQKNLFDGINDGASYGLFKVFGRILHHIQDMSTPSHVLPIYHARGKQSDPYEIFLVDNSNSIFKSIMSEPLFNGFDHDNHNDFQSLYHKSAGRLLGYLNSEESRFSLLRDGVEIEKDTSVFWQPYNASDNNRYSPCKIEGFGSFGILGHEFGNTDAITSDENTYKVSAQTYMRLSATMVSMAINDTLEALSIFENKINEQYSDFSFLLDDPETYD